MSEAFDEWTVVSVASDSSEECSEWECVVCNKVYTTWIEAAKCEVYDVAREAARVRSSSGS